MGLLQEVSRPAGDVEIHYLFSQTARSLGAVIGAPVTRIEHDDDVTKTGPPTDGGRLSLGNEFEAGSVRPGLGVAHRAEPEPIALAVLDREHQPLMGSHERFPGPVIP